MTDQRYRVRSHIWTADLGDGETALFNNQTQRYLTMNETARAIWNVLRQTASTCTVAQALVEEFDVTVADAKQAVAEFIDRLLEEDLIQEA